MKKIIFKYNLTTDDGLISSEPIRVQMRKGPVRSVQVQFDRFITMWAEHVAEHTEIVERKFRCIDTGRPFELPVNYIYLGTVQLADGNYIKHIYEIL